MQIESAFEQMAIKPMSREQSGLLPFDMLQQAATEDQTAAQLLQAWRLIMTHSCQLTNDFVSINIVLTAGSACLQGRHYPGVAYTSEDEAADTAWKSYKVKHVLPADAAPADLTLAR